MKISPEMLSPYCQDLSECLNLRGGAVLKLVPNLQDKTNYVVHYRVNKDPSPSSVPGKSMAKDLY